MSILNFLKASKFAEGKDIKTSKASRKSQAFIQTIYCSNLICYLAGFVIQM